jgi:hypothetical protein
VGLFTTALLVYALLDARERQAQGAVSAERSELLARGDRRQALGASRSDWLHAHGAEASFPCGVVRPAHEGADDASLALVRGMDLELPVTAAILRDAVAFLAEPPEGSGVHEVIEVGRIPRAALGQADVLDETGAHVPEPAREDFEEARPVWLVLTWTGPDGPDREIFLFRSTWRAWDAARRLRAAAAPV